MAVAPANAAGHTVVAYTTDSDSGVAGGKAIFHGNTDPEWAQVCDTKADGMRAWAQVSWRQHGQWQDFTLEDADGSSSFCDNDHAKQHQIPEGTQVTIEVCLKDGANGPRKYCGSNITDA
ncbi:hypothetical protein ACIGXF_38500 [Streptomyces sp. NPDC053086]|uniref:hypothetical protein n=1 Tax=unclassified Streptomyces TaxID=2593676 RepID=UPI0037D0EF26